MISMTWLIARFSYSYLSSSELVRALKVPVVIPLIPYLPELFKLDFLPPFYFTYWIIIIALIAIPHEFAHGIFARLNKVKVHSTGFGFLGPFLAAFVEPDEKHMQKRGIFAQLSVLAAGTFANILAAVLCALLLWGFFATAFVPAGITFNSYATTAVNLSDVNSINGVPIQNFSLDNINTTQRLSEVEVDNTSYQTNTEILYYMFANEFDYIVVYDDAPAFNARLNGTIISIDGEKISSFEVLRNKLSQYSPGDNVSISTLSENNINNYSITLGDNNGTAFLGIGTIPTQRSGILSGVYSVVASVKDPNVYYESRIGDIGIFLYDLLWWSILINISVALVNMLPVGLFDGGRFFYLTILAITKNEKHAMFMFKMFTYLILLLVAAMTVKWIFAFT